MQPRHIRWMDGTTYTVGRIVLAFNRVEGEHGYSLVESIEPPGVGAGLHRHASYEETFFVCAGRYQFQVGDTRYTAETGETLFIPRSTTHGFTCVGPETGRLLTISTPGGIFEAFIRELSEQLGEPAAARDRATVARNVAARHGIEFL